MKIVYPATQKDSHEGLMLIFCSPCFKKVAEVVNKYDKGIPSEEYEIFNKLWNDSLFGKK